MRKKLYFLFLAVFLCISLPGCGKNNNENITNENSSSGETRNPDNQQDEVTTSPASEETDMPDNEQTSEVTETIEPKAGQLSASQQYSDAYREVKFLVLFLSIRNTSNEKDYINPNYITAKIDGKEIGHTFLVNEPFSYPTIFTNIEPGRAIGGFIVWEVPKNWSKLEMEYSAWKNIDGLTLSAKFSPEDLSDPLMYNAVNFN